MLKLLKKAQPVIKREDWVNHSRRHELLKKHLQTNRYKSPPSTANVLLPILKKQKY